MESNVNKSSTLKIFKRISLTTRNSHLPDFGKFTAVNYAKFPKPRS
jgi:hypothetical protein